MKKSCYTVLILAGALLVLISGCATEQFVRDQISQIDSELSSIRDDVNTNKSEIEELKTATATISGNIQDAMERAETANKLAEGTFLYEATISDASISFAFDKSMLSDEANEALDVIVQSVINENQNVYLEIQGHADSRGPEAYNQQLAFERAMNVYNYLHLQHNVPLHRMNAFSYGEGRPVAENDNSENRAKNRRVTIIVMK